MLNGKPWLDRPTKEWSVSERQGAAYREESSVCAPTCDTAA